MSSTSPAAAALSRAFEQHLRRSHGASDGTCAAYTHYVRRFLSARYADRPPDLAALEPAQVSEFVADQCGRYAPHSVQVIASALRAFLRFLHARGDCGARVAAAVPSVACRSARPLPAFLTPESSEMVLRAPDRRTALGRRDYAILMCGHCLGLRAGEITRLCLDDIEWRTGKIHVRARKTRRGAVLPLPDRLGRALAAYLRRGRPATTLREVFIRHGARRGCALSSSGVSDIVRRAVLRAGIDAPSTGAHLLRHSLGARMIRARASLEEVAEILGHRSLRTTAIYAQLDLAALADVALPWPERAS